MKKCILIFSVLFCSLPIIAQEVTDDDFDKVVAACITLRDAAAVNDTAAIRMSAEQLRVCKPTDFSSLHQTEDETPSINGHLVFDEAFADSLVNGIDCYQKADSINMTIKERSGNAHSVQGKIRTKTLLIKANQTIMCTFAAKGRKRIAVVAETGGRVSMTLQGLYKKKPYTQYVDTKNVKKGEPHRKGTLALRNDCLSSVVMKIKNCVKRDISIVIIMG